MTPASTQSDYKAVLAQAQTLLQQNSAASALQLEQRAVQMDPTKPPAYGMMRFSNLLLLELQHRSVRYEAGAAT